MNWLLLVVRLSGATSRDRVAVWRELRRVGAAPVSHGVWTVPDTPFFASAVERAIELASRGSGDILVLAASGESGRGQDALRAAFEVLRVDEWAEFGADCVKFEEEIAKEIRIGKFTLAELEEEEQSLDRLRRWYRDLKSRDVLELPQASQGEERFQGCVRLLENYADQVYEALHLQPGKETGSTGDRETDAA